MDKVGIVILNYLNYKDTIECVDSLEDVNYNDKEIIIVDNGSSNESWKILNETFNSKENTYLINSGSNLGFAQGNNLGITYAREELKCKHVLVVNNDTVFEDKNIINELVNACEPGVGAIGPTIISRDGQNQNPVPKQVNKYDIEKEKRFINNEKDLIKDFILVRAINKIRRMIVDKTISNNHTKLVLHGSCMLLTDEFFEYYPYLYPKTFLYYEEDIFTLLTQKVSLRKKYINSTHIYHKEDQSSEMSFDNKESIKYKYMLESISLCLKLVDLEYEDIMSLYFNNN